MENKRLKLPIGIQTFETIRTEGYVYVDKTKHLIDLIDTGKIYFLARPRRFGKSLTISTFDALFSGKKELFNGLYAEAFVNRPHFEPSPVIRLDMSMPTTNCGVDVFKDSVKRIVMDQATRWEVDIPKDAQEGDMLRELIIAAYQKYNQKVVILLDEYDKPYTDFVNDPVMAEKVRDVLRSFYVQIKANDAYIRFTFITGISKFAKLGVFSTLNSPIDISLMPKYAAMCGYTEEEIIRYFPDYLEETATNLHMTKEALIVKMRHYYNGFSFDINAGVRLYNPFSTLLFFAQQEFLNYWMESGRSKVIADYLKTKSLTVEQFRNLPISIDFAQSPGDVDTAPPEGFLYQCGYLTLRPGMGGGLALDYPNTEVLHSMSVLLAQNLLDRRDDSFTWCRTDLLKGLMNRDTNRVISALNRLLATIPYDDFSSAARQSISTNDYEMKPQEWLYRSTILAFLRGCGVVVYAEMHTHTGRSDLVLSFAGQTWIIEIKVAYAGENAAQKAQEAYRQIIQKNYATPYPNAVCLGIGIDDSLRQITDYC